MFLAEFEDEVVSLLLGVRADEGGGHDHPGAIFLLQLVGFVWVGIDFFEGNELGPGGLGRGAAGE